MFVIHGLGESKGQFKAVHGVGTVPVQFNHGIGSEPIKVGHGVGTMPTTYNHGMGA